jgi:hypothetical protein
MGRTKSPVFNTRAAPKPVEAAQASESMETPSGSFSSATNSSTCPNCGSNFPDMSTKVCSPSDRVFNRVIHNSDLIQDFHDHVASCTRPSTAGSGTSESTLSPPPDSPNFDPASTIAVQDPDGGDDYRSVIGFGDVVDDQPGAKQAARAADQVKQVTSNENSNQNNGVEIFNQGAVALNRVQEEDKSDFAKITIAPYVDGEFDQYEYEVVQKDDEKKDEPEADLKYDDGQEILNDPEDPKVSDELKVIDDQEILEEPVTPDNGEVGDEIEATEVIEENLYRADTPTPLEVAADSNVDDGEVLRASEALTNVLLNTPAVLGGLEVPAESNIDSAEIPGPSQVTADSENRVDSEVASQIAGDAEDKPEKVVFKFKKFTPITAFEDFLKDAENMSYEELYHRTSVISDVLMQYQNEYDDVGRKLNNYESRKAFEKQIADEKKKAKEDQKKIDEKEAILAEDRLLIMLQDKYDAQLKLRGDKWVAFLEKFEASNGDKQHLDRLKKLHEGAFAAALAKRQRAAEKEAIPKVTLVRGDLPPLSKRDLESHWKKRKIIQDRVAFDEKKQADVYVQKYNSKMSGNQNLIDRNAVDAADDELNENGRPKRSTTKRAFYDTEQSETPPDTEPENLPAKRSRTKRIFDDGIASPGRPQTLFESRDGTPARVFPSGKRVGRPPGSKTKNPNSKATQSKLNTVQVASPSESEAEDGEAQNNQVESRAQELEPAQEEQLHAAATSLVEQTVEANAAAGGPVKKKHAGGRPKKKVAVEEPVAGPSNAPVEEVPIVPKPKNKGGRPRKHLVSAGGAKARGGRVTKEPVAEQASVQGGEEDEIIQSTEHDNESLFPSTSTSRPTTSSSGGTDATFGGRQTRRAATRAKSQATLEEPLDAPGASVSTNGRGKRKRMVTESLQPAEPAESGGDSEGENIVVDTYRPDLEEIAPVPPKKRKAVRGKKGKAVAQFVAPQEHEVTPEQTGEASNNTTGRPKRKRVPALPESSIDPDHLGDYLSDDDGETPPPSKRRKARGGRKGKSFKREETTDADTEVDGDSSVPPSRKRAARAVTKRNTIKQEMFDEEESDDILVPQPPKTRKSRTNTLIVAEGAGSEAGIGGSVEGDTGEGPSAPAPKKRTVASGDQAFEDIEAGADGGPSKKRKARAISKGKGVALGDSVGPEPATVKSEGTEIQNGNEDAAIELGGHGEADTESAPPLKKRKTRAVKGKAKTESTGEDELVDSEDYSGMDPAEAELLRKKKRKSRKLAAATRQRWANGTMKGPMEKRKATNAAKKAAKLAAKVAGAAGPAGPAGNVGGPVVGDGTVAVGDFGQGGVAQEVTGVPIAEPKIAPAQFMGGHVAGGQVMEGSFAAPGFAGPSNAAPIQAGPSPAKKPPATKPKIVPVPLQIAAAPAPGPAPARTSTRVRKPTSRMLGMDGAADDEDDEDDQLPSEYDRYQVLMSPKGTGLAKRVRKSYMDLSALGDDEDSF